VMESAVSVEAAEITDTFDGALLSSARWGTALLVLEAGLLGGLFWVCGVRVEVIAFRRLRAIFLEIIFFMPFYQLGENTQQL